jgi:ribonuclease HI
MMIWRNSPDISRETKCLLWKSDLSLSCQSLMSLSGRILRKIHFHWRSLFNLYLFVKLIVYTDWGARGNPGPAGCGVYITDIHWIPLEKRHKYLWVATNNIAEYTAALLWIERAIQIGASDIELRADSKLVIEQLSGNYRIKNAHLKEIASEIFLLIQNWGWNILFTHVPRENNKEADRLSNVAMDRQM